MKRILILIITFMFCIVFLTGCWDIRELNKLSIVTALGIDQDEEGYLVTVQIINVAQISKEKSTTQTSVTTHRTSGETLLEAFRKLKLEIPRKIYLAHLRILLFGEKFAKEEGIGKALDFISRDHEVRPDFYILIAKDIEAEKLLNILTPLDEIPANHVFSILEISNKLWGSTHKLRLDELINRIGSDGKEAVITGLIAKGDPDVGMEISNLEKIDVPTTIQMSSLSVFKKDKLVGWLTEEESIGYNHITGGIKSTVLSIPWEDGQIGIELNSAESKINGEVVDGKPKIKIEYSVEANISEVNSKVDLSDSENIDKVQKLIEKEIEKMMNATLEKAQKDFKSDIFGFGETIHISSPKEWKNIKIDWDKEFENLKVDIKVSAKIKDPGKILTSFQKEFDK